MSLTHTEHTGTLVVEIEHHDESTDTAHAHKIEVDYNLREDTSGDQVTPNGPHEIDIHKCRMLKSVSSYADGREYTFDVTKGGLIKRRWPLSWAAIVAKANGEAADVIHANLDDVEEKIADHVFGG